ncbi:putative importin [Smittium mucronatum]|uniref:Putative importin n=1 Tax=Smittium mucronatum TaxID=133383 RepID=A0A1R0H301_9FUNG|nr:putative importin [Smittium mucronatum]
MDASSLSSLFGNTFHADQQVRNQTEQKLNALESQPRFLSSVLNFLGQVDSNDGSSLAAAIYFKNSIRKNWKSRSEESSSQISISDQDQIFIKQEILPIMVKAAPNIQSQLQSCLATILSHDFPDNWIEFGPKIYELLNSNDIGSTKIGLIGLLELTQLYRFKPSKNRKPLYEVVSTLFPISLKIIESIIDSDDQNMQLMVKTGIKAFHASIQVDLPPPLMNFDVLGSWGSIFIKIITLNNPPFSPDFDESDLEEFEKLPLTKAKKWAHRSLNRLFNRYGCVYLLSSNSKKYKPFAKTFTENFAPKILQVYLLLISEYSSHKIIISSKSRYLISNFLADGIKDKTMWKLFKPHSLQVITGFIFPQLCYTESDVELWDSSPADYVNKRIDSLDDFNSPVLSAVNLLIDLVVERRSTNLVPTLQFINQILENYKNSPADSRDDRSKDGALCAMSNLSSSIKSKKSPISNSLDKFLIDYVFPEFVSKNKFLRARSLDTFTNYSDVQFSDPQIAVSVFDQVIILLTDPELPVRVYASLAIRPFIENESVKDVVISKLPTIVEQLLLITNQIDSDLVTDVIESLAVSYASQLEPFAVQLCQQLCDSFLRIMNESLNASASINLESSNKSFSELEDMSSKTMAAMGILRTLGTLIINLDSNTNTVLSIEQVVYPIIKFVLDNRIVDLYEESFEIIDCCTFNLKQISPSAYELFGSIYNSFMDSGIDFIEDMLPSLDNYISFGLENFMSNQELRQRVYLIIEMVMKSDRVGESGRISGCKLIESVILNTMSYNNMNPGSPINIDDLVAQFLALANNYLGIADNFPRTNPFLIYLLELVLNSLQYNPDLTVKALTEFGSINSILELIVTKKNLFKLCHDKRVYILGTCNLIQAVTSNTNTPNSIYHNFVNGIPLFMKAVLECVKGYPEALKARSDLEKLYNKEYNADDLDDADNYDSDPGSDYEDEDPNNEFDQAVSGFDENSASKSNSNAGISDDISDNELHSDDDYDFNGYGDDDDDIDELEEDLYFESPIDNVNVYLVITKSLEFMKSTNSSQFDSMISQLSPQEQQLLVQVSEQSRVAQ